ncbi:hypothetical protein EVAR_5422_1 [Eumeta japonica]|uniref:Uncharacterized protein n=1 Tax=Eumeta variegata TaxID=151549 RepID=A0A4C1TB71_EUMVA|nr:hypothetical protein EVAR_5422_1 [Eumeta japonica]
MKVTIKHYSDHKSPLGRSFIQYKEEVKHIKPVLNHCTVSRFQLNRRRPISPVGKAIFYSHRLALYSPSKSPPCLHRTQLRRLILQLFSEAFRRTAIGTYETSPAENLFAHHLLHTSFKT